jgi:hypothetical protein
LVTLCACEMLFPNCGPLPQMSHTFAIVQLQTFESFTAAWFRWSASRTPHSASRIFSIQGIFEPRQRS